MIPQVRIKGGAMKQLSKKLSKDQKKENKMIEKQANQTKVEYIEKLDQEMKEMTTMYKEPVQESWNISGEEAIKSMDQWDSYEYETPAQAKAATTVYETYSNSTYEDTESSSEFSYETVTDSKTGQKVRVGQVKLKNATKKAEKKEEPKEEKKEEVKETVKVVSEEEKEEDKKIEKKVKEGS